MFLVNIKKYNLSWVILLLALSITACKSTLYPKENRVTQSKIDTSILEDPQIKAFYAPYKKALDSQMNSVLVISSIELQKQAGESALSNFFADAVSSTCKSKNFNFDFAMPTTNGGIRTSLPKGEIKLQNAFELMPFENELVILYLDGSSVRKLVQFIVDKQGQPISGIKIEAKDGQILNININNTVFDESKTYRVLTSDYLANGGDGIDAFKEARKRESTNIKVRDAIIAFMRSEKAAGRSLNPTIDGRLNIK